MLSPGKQRCGGRRGGNAVPGNELLTSSTSSLGRAGHRELAQELLKLHAPTAWESVSTVARGCDGWSVSVLWECRCCC